MLAFKSRKKILTGVKVGLNKKRFSLWTTYCVFLNLMCVLFKCSTKCSIVSGLGGLEDESPPVRFLGEGLGGRSSQKLKNFY